MPQAFAEAVKQMHSCVWLLLTGVVAGGLSWALLWGLTGHFEPYDSGVGLALNQLLLCGPMVLLRRYRLIWFGLYPLGAWLGMNAWAYWAGSSETRAWAEAGAAISLLLLVLPVVGWVLAGVWRWYRSQSPVSGRKRG